jgi:hypothetical protein
LSYDLYCYRPTSAVPDPKEAEAVIASEEEAVFRDDEEARLIKQSISKALMEYNPRLEPFKVDHNEVAKMLKVSVQEARTRWNHIELNPPEGDLRVQLNVYWDHVDLTIPYWYTGAKADAVFQKVAEYLRVISKAARFFAYDPQTGRAFDPAKEECGGHEEYDRIAENLPAIVAQGVPKKPWWKLW